MQTKATRHFWPAWVLHGDGDTDDGDEVFNKRTYQWPPIKRRRRRPMWSTAQSAGIVMPTLTTAVAIVIVKGLAIPDCLKKVVP
jgi:hypothetical protein